MFSPVHAWVLQLPPTDKKICAFVSPTLKLNATEFQVQLSTVRPCCQGGFYWLGSSRSMLLWWLVGADTVVPQCKSMNEKVQLHWLNRSGQIINWDAHWLQHGKREGSTLRSINKLNKLDCFIQVRYQTANLVWTHTRIRSCFRRHLRINYSNCVQKQEMQTTAFPKPSR